MERRPLLTKGTRAQEDERVEEMTLRVVAGEQAIHSRWIGIRIALHVNNSFVCSLGGYSLVPFDLRREAFGGSREGVGWRLRFDRFRACKMFDLAQ